MTGFQTGVGEVQVTVRLSAPAVTRVGAPGAAGGSVIAALARPEPAEIPVPVTVEKEPAMRSSLAEENCSTETAPSADGAQVASAPRSAVPTSASRFRTAAEPPDGVTEVNEPPT